MNFIKGRYHLYHLMSNLLSTLMYLLLSSVNTIAAKWGLSFSLIGLMNFTGALSYILTSFMLGRLGDRYGHKRVISYAFLAFSAFNLIGFFLSNTVELFVFIIGINVFFGTFFPQIEGLLSKHEKKMGIDAASTINRFNISWSTGNILGIVFGPFLIVRFPYLVFGYSILLNLFAFFLIRKDILKNGERIHFTPSSKIKIPSHAVDFPKISLYRRTYRVTLVLSGLIYAAFLSLFPKLATFSGIPISMSGFLAAGANLGVLITFIVLAKIRIWVGNPVKAFFMMIGFPITTILLFIPTSVPQFFLLAFFSGITYAVPYTYAIFYALNSPDEDHSKQGGFHEATIGTLSGLGPFLGGIVLQLSNGIWGLAMMAALLLTGVVALQVNFFKKIKIM